MDIFDGRDIRVVARLFDEAKDGLVVTFTGRAASPPVEKGFGENYLIKRRMSAVHFISKDNHWWQTPEPAAAIEVLRTLGLIGGDRKVTLYGSSMGGYAALILSRLIRPKRIVLFSPQYSIDALRVPFEKRWRAYAARLKFDYDDMAQGIDHDAEIKVVYDPFFEPDRRHVELIEQLRPVEHVPVRFAGHNTARTLEELGIITRVIDELLFDAFSVQDFLELYRRTRASSSLFWYGLSQALAHHGHHAGAMLASCAAAKILLSSGRMKDPVLRRDILRSALSMTCEADKPSLAKEWLVELKKVESSNVRMAYAQALVARAEGDWPQVDKQLDGVASRKGGEPAHVALKIEALSKLAGPTDALRYSENLQAHQRRAPLVLRAQGRILVDAMNWTAAAEVLQKCIRHDRLDPTTRVLCARCWFELGHPDAAIKQLSPIIHYHLASTKLADEVAHLMEKGRGPRHADKVRTRHKRYMKLFAAVMAALDEIGPDRKNSAIPSRELRQLKSARA